MQRRTVRLHDLSARDVVARAESTKVGSLSDLFFSPRDGRLGALKLETSSGFGGLVRGTSWVRADNLLAIGADALVIRDRASVIEGDDEVDRTDLLSAAEVKGKTVVTDRGERIGKVVDLDLLPDDGRIANYVIVEGGGGSFNLGLSQERRPERLVPVQPDVVVGPDLITIPAEVLRQAPRQKGPEGGMDYERRPQGDESASDREEPFNSRREEH